MILIDTNALLVVIVGLIDTKLINKHKRTSIYEEQDFYDLISIIGNMEKLAILPNVWTEVDNLLNRFTGEYKSHYINIIYESMKASSEKYIESLRGVKSIGFFNLGLTDSLLLELAMVKECELLVTSDSNLSDYAKAHDVNVYDIVKIRNERL